jgi:predicted nucleic acid-binding protein
VQREGAQGVFHAHPSHAEAEERLRRLLAENDLPMPDEVVHRPAEVVFLYTRRSWRASSRSASRTTSPLADLVAAARDQQRRAGAMDAIIAGTALAHDLAVWTQDGDFDVLAELAPALRVERA